MPRGCLFLEATSRQGEDYISGGGGSGGAGSDGDGGGGGVGGSGNSSGGAYWLL